jgi:hypothetical protein
MDRLIAFLIRQPVLVLVALGLPVFLGNYFAGRPGISGWDANFYFSYAAAIADGGTLELEHTYREMVARGADPVAFDIDKRTPTGQVANFYPLGHPVLHTPATFVGRLLSGDAFGSLAQLCFCLSALLGAAIGLEAVRRALAPALGDEATAVGLYSAAATTMLGYYWFVLPAHSHTSSILVGGLAFALLVRLLAKPGLSSYLYATLGVLIGWMVMIRLQDLGAGALALVMIGALVVSPGLSTSAKAQRVAALVLAGLATVSIQLLHWHWKDGTWLPRSYNDYSHFDFSQSFHLAVLFSPRHGLFLWHPAFALALAGLVLLWRRGTDVPAPLRLALLGTVGLAIGVLLIGGFYSIWWFGDSFGSRPFLSATPAVVAGLAMLWQLARERRLAWLYVAVAGTLAVANGALAIAFHLGWISRSGPLF